MSPRIRTTHSRLRALAMLIIGSLAMGSAVGCGSVYPDAATTKQIKAAQNARGEQPVSPGAGLRTTTTNPRLPQDPDKSPKDDTPNDTGPK